MERENFARYSRHREYISTVTAPAPSVFAYVDEHMRLSSHMSQSSWKMGGGAMTVNIDADGGKRVGSRIRLSGRVFGMVLSVDEVVTERAPPHRKIWETVDEPHLLVIGRYRMGFDIAPVSAESTLRVFIDYDLPAQVRWRWLGYLLGDYYALWCTRQMVEDAARHFRRKKSL